MFAECLKPLTLNVAAQVLLMNTQSGTQVDGLRHYGCMAGKCYYNGELRPHLVDHEHVERTAVNEQETID